MLAQARINPTGAQRRLALLDGVQDVGDVGHAVEHTPAGSRPRPETGSALSPTGQSPPAMRALVRHTAVDVTDARKQFGGSYRSDQFRFGTVCEKS